MDNTASRTASDQPITGTSFVAPLRHFVFVNYAVPPERIQQHLPPQLEVETRTDENGEKRAFVSVLIFQYNNFGLSALPWPRINFFQNNYRTYVRYKDVPSVFLFRMMEDTRLAGVFRRLMGMPTYYSAMSLQVDWDAQKQYYRRYRFEGSEPGYSILMDIEGVDEYVTGDSMFSNPEDLVRFFTHPPAGYYREADSERISSAAVTHKLVKPKRGILREGRVDLFDQLGIMPKAEQNQPHSILMINRVDDFTGYAPVRNIKL